MRPRDAGGLRDLLHGGGLEALAVEQIESRGDDGVASAAGGAVSLMGRASVAPLGSLGAAAAAPESRPEPTAERPAGER